MKDGAPTKLLYLILNRSEKEWKMPPREWTMAKDQFTVGNFVRETDYRHQMTNLSPKITANWVFASVHSRGGRFHS